MAVKMRLARAGTKKRPYYHIVIADAAAPRDGKFIDVVGAFNPMLKKDAIGANAWTVVKRSDFNMGKYAPNVGDDVRIDIAIEAIKQ